MKNPLTKLLLKLRIYPQIKIQLIGFIFGLLVVSYIFFKKNNPFSKNISDITPIYNTWKVAKEYKNGKLIVSDDQNKGLRFRVNKNGTADWINDGYENNFPFILSQKENHWIATNSSSGEDFDIIYDLKTDLLRFGKRDVYNHYEYVMIPWDK